MPFNVVEIWSLYSESTKNSPKNGKAFMSPMDSKSSSVTAESVTGLGAKHDQQYFDSQDFTDCQLILQ